MRPLFIRVLAVLLGSFLLIAVLSYFLFGLISKSLDPRDHQLHEQSLALAKKLSHAYVTGEHKPIMRKLHKYRQVRSWILNKSNVVLVGPPMPDGLLKKIDGYPLVIRPYRHNHDHPHQQDAFVFAHEVVVNEVRYKVILAANKQPFRPRNRPGFIAIPIFAGLFGLILASGLLTYWMLRPLKVLQQTAKSISPGNLETEIPVGITKRKDAFGELGKEFNAMTKRVNQAITSQQQLLRDVSHELRSPLARIQVAASIALNKGGAESELDRIEQEVVRLDHLIEQLLSVSRLQNNLVLVKEKVDLIAVLRRVIDDANFEFSKKPCLAVLSASTTVTLYGDPDLLASAFENIIRNSLRFSPENEKVQVSVLLKDTGIEVKVTDCGPGVQPDHLAMIFEPFFRGDSARNISEGHHGVGLALSQTIVELHGGTITAENVAVGGLEVTTVLPVSEHPHAF